MDMSRHGVPRSGGVLSLIVVAVMSVLLSACAPPPRVDTASGELIIADPSLRGKLTLAGLNYQRGGANPQAQVVLTNETGKGIIVEYQFQWMDERGFSLQDDRMWHQVTLSPYGRATLTSTATRPEGARVRLSVRRPYSEF